MAILKVNKLTIVDTPTRGTKGSAGIDLYMPQSVVVPANARGMMIHLGLAIEVEEGHYTELISRSSTGIRTPVRLSNEAGIIDSDFRGEICAIVDNLSDEDYMLKRGERYFQLIVHKHHCDDVQVVYELSDTERGASGVGSTGK